MSHENTCTGSSPGARHMHNTTLQIPEGRNRANQLGVPGPSRPTGETPEVLQLGREDAGPGAASPKLLQDANSFANANDSL